MEIRRVEYKNIYGTLSGKLEFGHGENFLVGINGCGKTTVLNLIRWVLGPNFPELLALQHDLIRIDVKHKKHMYSIESRIIKGKYELKVVTRDKSRKFNPITAVLGVGPRKIPTDTEEIRARYDLKPEDHEVSTWNFLMRELPSPVFIGLERSVENDPSDQTVRRIQRHPTAIGRARTLMRDAFNTGRQRLVVINNRLNLGLLDLIFSSVLPSKLDSRAHFSGDIARKIPQLKKEFENSANKDLYSDLVVKYLGKLSSLLNSKTKKDKDWVMNNQHNLNRAGKVVDLLEKRESEVQKAQREISSFKKEVNRFIGDSGKSIHFDNDTGAPHFETRAHSSRLRLSELSSGETQVVVLLSYFAFHAKEGIPIVIDEPELSLHVKWQKYFVNAVKEVMPEECQTIMATHSPEICGAEDVNVQSISVRATQ